jgi:SAM-dependent methyltransferase
MWGRDWRAGPLHSCACAFSGNYQGATAAFWERQFALLPEDSVVVDVGTGNGAIPLLAKSVASSKAIRLDIHGIDLADIDPVAAAGDGGGRYTGIRFHPRTSLTALPFADGSVDMVSGQFAIEYAPLDAAVAEVARVLGRRGRAAFVLHSRDSVIVSTTAEQLESCRLILDETDFYGGARALAGLLANARSPEQRQALAADARADSARRLLNQSAQAISDRAAMVATPDLLRSAITQVTDALRAAPAWGEARCRHYLQGCEAALRDERQRLLDLDAAALSRADAERLLQRFCQLGFADGALAPLEHAPGLLMGWTLCVQRRDD